MTTGHKPVQVSEHELSEIRALIETRSGILFDGSRERFFSTRISEHLHEKKLAHGTDLLRTIKTSNVEYDALLERLLTQETSFFRYPEMFQALQRTVLPEMHSKKFWATPRKLRIWSAGCSTGEEPYSIAIAVSEALSFAEAWEIEILATDISRRALDVAERGVYSRRTLQNLTPLQIETHFTRMGEQYSVRPRIRQMVKFAPLNLAQAVYMGRFDCIFCMNVLIYFARERRSQLITRFHDYLEPGGYLFLGHAETTSHAPVKFKTIVVGDNRVYQKPLESPIVRAAAAGEDKA
jgi:chemotaxis protein methyltransferase CheR